MQPEQGLQTSNQAYERSASTLIIRSNSTVRTSTCLWNMRALLILIVLTCAALAQSTSTSQAEPVAQENSAKAKVLLDQTIQALGGDAYLGVQDISQQGRTYSFHHGETTSTGVLFWRFVKFPDKERIEVTKQRDVAYVYNGDNAYEITFKGTALQDAKTTTEYIRRREHSLEWVLRRWLKEPGVALFYEGAALAADKPAEQVSIMNTRNESVTLYLDTTTHLPIKKKFSWRDPTDKLLDSEEEVYDAYRPTQGIMTPYSVTRFYNGDMSNQRFLNTVSYNGNLSDAMFDAKATYQPGAVPPKKSK